VSETASGPTPDAISGDRSVGTLSIATEVTETHLSILFFLGERVYKLRKPVDFGFVDFTKGKLVKRTARGGDSQPPPRTDVFIGVADVLIDGEAVTTWSSCDECRRTVNWHDGRRGDDLGVWLTQVAQTSSPFIDGRAVIGDLGGRNGSALRACGMPMRPNRPFLSSILDAELDGELQELAAAG